MSKINSSNAYRMLLFELLVVWTTTRGTMCDSSTAVVQSKYHLYKNQSEFFQFAKKKFDNKNKQDKIQDYIKNVPSK